MTNKRPTTLPQMSMTPLANKIAIVTGGSRGIGKAIAMELARQGAFVAICGRDEQSLNQALEEVQEATGQKVWRHKCDVRKEEEVQAFVQWCRQELGDAHILVNNAGVFKTQPVADQPLNVWQDVIDINLTGAMLFSRAVVKTMVQKSFGRIINISSISGRSGEIWASAYSASKFGMIGLTQSLAMEVAPSGVTVNAVCPGWVQTEMTDEQLKDPEWCRLNGMSPDSAQTTACYAIPQERFTQPAEVASLVAYLCSDIAGGITGQSINICGGLSMK